MSAVRLGGRLKELRIHLCQTGPQSAGVREFIQTCYVNLKKTNPTFPILIRECKGIQPRIWARYERGREICEPLTDLKCDQVYSIIQKLNKII